MLRLVPRQAVQQLKQTRPWVPAHSSANIRCYATAQRDTAPFDWKDPLGAHKNLFTEEELDIAETAESYCQERLLPRVLGTVEREPPLAKAR